eukprot:42937_1
MSGFHPWVSQTIKFYGIHPQSYFKRLKELQEVIPGCSNEYCYSLLHKHGVNVRLALQAHFNPQNEHNNNSNTNNNTKPLLLRKRKLQEQKADHTPPQKKQKIMIDLTLDQGIPSDTNNYNINNKYSAPLPKPHPGLFEKEETMFINKLKKINIAHERMITLNSNLIMKYINMNNLSLDSSIYSNNKNQKKSNINTIGSINAPRNMITKRVIIAPNENNITNNIHFSDDESESESESDSNNENDSDSVILVPNENNNKNKKPKSVELLCMNDHDNDNETEYSDNETEYSDNETEYSDSDEEFESDYSESNEISDSENEENILVFSSNNDYTRRNPRRTTRFTKNRYSSDE